MRHTIFNSFFIRLLLTCPCGGIHYLVCVGRSADGGGPFQVGEACAKYFLIKVRSTCFDWSWCMRWHVVFRLVSTVCTIISDGHITRTHHSIYNNTILDLVFFCSLLSRMTFCSDTFHTVHNHKLVYKHRHTYHSKVLYMLMNTWTFGSTCFHQIGIRLN